MTSDRNKARAEYLSSLLAERLVGIEWDWSKNLCIPSPISVRSDFSGGTDVSTPSMPIYEFKREDLPYFINGRKFEAYRIVVDGLIIEAAYREGEHWWPLLDEIGASA